MPKFQHVRSQAFFYRKKKTERACFNIGNLDDAKKISAKCLELHELSLGHGE